MSQFRQDIILLKELFEKNARLSSEIVEHCGAEHPLSVSFGEGLVMADYQPRLKRRFNQNATYFTLNGSGLLEGLSCDLGSVSRVYGDDSERMVSQLADKIVSEIKLQDGFGYDAIKACIAHLQGL